ncbi:MAG: hypothetical protein ACXAB2_15545 [Candidatus Hodarchaeales archaeon]|jgi:hypothetical protein
MKRFHIVEIEKSFFTLFTPAVVVAAGYFLFNLLSWPFLVLEYTLEDQIDGHLMEIISPLFRYIALSLICIISYLLFIPKLKIRYVNYRSWKNVNSFFLSILLIFVGVVGFHLLLLFFSSMTWDLMYIYPFYIDSTSFFDIFMYIVNQCILASLFTSLVYQRISIPLLEDRGLSPLHALILSSLGRGFMNIPVFLLQIYEPNDNLFNFLWPFFLGFLAGTSYVLTRNILFPLIINGFFELYLILPLTLYNLIFISATVGIIILVAYYLIPYFQKVPIIQEWKSILTKRSAPHMGPGITGFFPISIGLLLMQYIVVSIVRDFVNLKPVTDTSLIRYGQAITIAYFIIFLIPFWLIISTEYAQSPE